MPVASRPPRGRRALRSLGVVVLLGGGWALLRAELHHRLPAPTAELRAEANKVRILRDRFGVPHIFGETDADAAFGLAYAHAEDDFPMIQGVLAASRGQLGLLQISKQAVLNDYFTRLMDVRGIAEAGWPKLSPEVRAVCDAYARGLSLYAALHPRQADARLWPFTGKDVAAGFVHKMPILLGVPDVLGKLSDREWHAGDQILREETKAGSNAHAVSAARSADGIARLNINSHQPWEGPVAWYEAQVVSKQGLNLTGGLFPGSPVVLHGHNETLGWAHTVNSPSLVDVYELEVSGGRYRHGAEWLPLVKTTATLSVDLGLFTIPIPKEVLASVHGPVLEVSGRFYAVRYAGRERSASTVEQWYRMGKAATFEEWRAAMAIQAIPMFNAVYADAANIHYLYNAVLPVREPGSVPGRILKGDDPKQVWTRYLPFEKLPQVTNPPSGFVFNTNATPFAATEGPGNPEPTRYAAADGIETLRNNRTMRSLQLFGGDKKISAADLERFKFDRGYAPQSKMRAMVAGLVEQVTPADENEKRALDVLRAWDGETNPESTAAALAILTFRPPEPGGAAADAFRRAVAFLARHHGRVDVPLGEVQRLRRGALDLPLGGGPDVLNAAYTRIDGGQMVGTQGDSLILLVEFGPGGARSRAISQYGASNRKGSPHYADQAPLFLKHELRPSLRTESEIRGFLEREYHPGEDVRQ